MVAEFFAQARNVHVDGAGGHAARVYLPDGGQQLIAGDGAGRIGGQIAEQIGLFLREVLALTGIEAQLAAMQIGLQRGGGEADQTDAGRARG